MIALLLTALLVLTAAAVLSACGGFTVTYVLPEGATGTAPASATYAQYDVFKAPEGTGLEKNIRPSSAGRIPAAECTSRARTSRWAAAT